MRSSKDICLDCSDRQTIYLYLISQAIYRKRPCEQLAIDELAILSGVTENIKPPQSQVLGPKHVLGVSQALGLLEFLPLPNRGGVRYATGDRRYKTCSFSLKYVKKKLNRL
ncbi:hypothetical protein TNCV_2154561 [Trichonephila clavipes]|nr:hypothetical protein TNCV_2154561 [Trichonephila clavipes]